MVESRRSDDGAKQQRGHYGRPSTGVGDQFRSTFAARAIGIGVCDLQHGDLPGRGWQSGLVPCDYSERERVDGGGVDTFALRRWLLCCV